MFKKALDTGVGQTIEMFAKSIYDKVKGGFQRLVGGIFKSKLNKQRTIFNEQVKSGTYKIDLAFEVAKKELPSPAFAKQWFLKYAQDHMYKGVLIQGQLYSFLYENPKGKLTLDHFDKFPLVLSFGVYFASTGNIVEMGVNLHYLPPQIRELLLKDIIELFMNQYAGEMYSEKPRSINQFNYQVLQQFETKYNVSYAIHSYLPELRRKTVIYEFSEWPHACQDETTGFSGATIEQIKAMYLQQVAENKKNKGRLR